MKQAKQKITYGILQRSVLGPVLFIIYVNDMPDKLKPIRKILRMIAKSTRALEKLLIRMKYKTICLKYVTGVTYGRGVFLFPNVKPFSMDMWDLKKKKHTR